MARWSVEDITLTGIANAIREKTGGSGEIKVEDMAGKIGEISGGGASVETCTVNINVLNDGNNTDIVLYYLGADGEPHSVATGTSYGKTYSGEVECVKGSILIIGNNFMTASGSAMYLKISDTLDRINTISLDVIVFVNGDGSISY